MRVRVHMTYLTKARIYQSMSPDASAEKITRAALKSAAVRLLTKKAFVILDSLNYFKSSRYEMFRFAVEQGTSHCVVRTAMDWIHEEMGLEFHVPLMCQVYIDEEKDVAREWNSARDNGYTDEMCVGEEAAPRHVLYTARGPVCG